MKSILITAICLLPIIAFSQLGVSFHQSNIPFIGVNYQFSNKFRGELRVNVDVYTAEMVLEPVVTYDFIKKEDYEFYAGLGLRLNTGDGAGVIPVGLNFYPFNEKKFGFHIEVAPIIQDFSIIRGSWGIRYRFLK